MGQIVVISGVGAGMGREAAKLLAATDVTIVGFDVDSRAIDSLRQELAATSSMPHHLVPLDVCDRKGIVAFRDEVLSRYGRVDTVLANVGVGFFGPFEEADLEAAMKCLEINVIGTAAIFQAFVPTMRRQGSGKLIAMSSLVGQVPFPFESIYSASKFAIEGMVMSLRYEVEPFGIRVALIQPGQVATSFAAKVHQLPAADSPYRERVHRFIARDDVLIRSAPSAEQAGKRIAKVVRDPTPPFHNQIDFKSRVFLVLNRFLPVRLRDAILVRHMDIR
jgi:short-subunit dehydrogenase